MLQDQHWRFARHAGNLAKDEFIGNQVGKHGYGNARERLHNVRKPIIVLAGRVFLGAWHSRQITWSFDVRDLGLDFLTNSARLC